LSGQTENQISKKESSVERRKEINTVLESGREKLIRLHQSNTELGGEIIGCVLLQKRGGGFCEGKLWFPELEKKNAHYILGQ